jgi:transposase
LSREHLAVPRQRGHREALRVLQLTRAGAVKVAADGRRQLKALLVTAPEPLRAALGGRTWLQQARACAALQTKPAAAVEDRASVLALRLTAERVLRAHAEAKTLEQELRALVATMTPCCWPSPVSARSPPPSC